MSDDGKIKIQTRRGVRWVTPPLTDSNDITTSPTDDNEISISAHQSQQSTHEDGGRRLTRRGYRSNNSKKIEDDSPAKFWDTLRNDPRYTGFKYSSDMFGDDDLTENEIIRNTNWLHAARVVYDMEHNSPYDNQNRYSAWDRLVAREGWSEEEANRELGEWALNHIGWYNYNTVSQASQTSTILDDDRSLDQIIAFKYLADIYDHKSMSWAGWGRAGKGIAADPLTYVGIGTVATVAKLAIGKELSGKATALLAGKGALSLESAIYGRLDSLNREKLSVAAGAQDEIDYKKVNRDTFLAGAIGLGFAQAVPVVARNFKPAVKATWNFVDPRNNTTWQKAVTAGVAVSAPSALVAHNAISEEQEKEVSQKGAQQIINNVDTAIAKAMEEQLSAASSISVENISLDTLDTLPDDAPENITMNFNNTSPQTAIKGRTASHRDFGIDPIALLFHNRAHGVAENIRKPVISVNVSSAMAKQIMNSLDTKN